MRHVILQRGFELQYIDTKSFTDEAYYDALVKALDELQIVTGYDNSHPLDHLVNRLATLIEAYDIRVRPMPRASGIDVLGSFMEEHKLTHSDLPELGDSLAWPQFLSGRRTLDFLQAQRLAKRFGVTPETFLGS